MWTLAAEANLPISTSYRYLHDAIDVIADQAPDLHDVLDMARRQGWSHVTVDGTLIEIDRVNERTETVIICGTRQAQNPGRQRADPGRPERFPVWSHGRDGQCA
jgi:hypothetical protein